MQVIVKALDKNRKLKSMPKIVSEKMHNLFKSKDTKELCSQRQNPVVKAHNIWKLVSGQIHDILEEEIHLQWFSKIVPLVISDSCLILMAPNSLNCHWVNQHYKELIDLLISFQDESLSSFVINQKDINN